LHLVEVLLDLTHFDVGFLHLVLGSLVNFLDLVLVIIHSVIRCFLVLLLQSLDLRLQLNHLFHRLIVVPGQPQYYVLFILVLLLVLVLQLVDLGMPGKKIYTGNITYKV